MNSKSISGIRTDVALIIQAYAEGSHLFQKWRKRNRGNKAVGSEELATSLYDGEVSVEAKLNGLSLRHGSRFDIGDRQSRKSLEEIQKEFRRTLIDVLISSTAKEGGKDVSIDPIALRLISEATRKDTLQTMDELSRRLEAQAAVPRRIDFTPTDPGDRLPPMPLLVTPTSSQRLSVNHQAPIPRLEDLHRPVAVPIVNSPVFDSREDLSKSLDITRRRPSTSGIFRMFSPKPRPHYLLPSLPPSPAVVPSYTCTEDPSAILEKGEASVARLWAAANGSLNSPQDERFLSYPHSAPLPQVPWDIQTRDISRSSTPTLYKRDVTPPSPDLTPLPISSPMGYESGWPPLQSGKRIRSEPVITFSAPPPRFKRNVTGPPHPS